MTSRRYPAKAFAVFAVLLLTLSVLPMIGVYAPKAEGYEGESYNVVYHPGNPGNIDINYNDTTTPGNLEIKYFGTPISEYNPQFWTDTSEYRGYINGEIQNGTLQNWYRINQYVNDQTVVFTGWYISDSSGNVVGTEPIDPGTDLTSRFSENDVIHLVATWDTANVKYYNDDVSSFGFNGGTKYTNIAVLTGDTHFRYSGINQRWENNISNCTIRSDVNSNYNLELRTYRSGDIYVYANHLSLDGHVIIDNVTLYGSSYGVTNNPTSQTENGLYAGGNTLILGTGIECTRNPYVQVFGGSYSSSPSKTDVRIFSGTYSNVIGGSEDGANDTIGTVNLTILGDTNVIEAVWGASISSGSTVNTTNILIAGGTVNEKGYTTDQTIPGGFSTVVGGSRSGNVGTTNVEVTGDAVVFAVQGGGREPGTNTTTANVTISGKATVQHMVCGSLTDGNDQYSDPPVGESFVEVKDSANVKDVYGGGWDLWTNPLYPSTGKTNVVISGGHISGSVYGGGFRGSVGTSTFTGITTTVTVTGGIIDGSVYGGGQGGPDPVSSGNSNTTGRAYVYGGVEVNITGGVIGQNVYGGGQGAQMTSNDINYNGGNYDEGGVRDTAKVTGNVIIHIGGDALVEGSVYGGGMGLSESVAENNNDVSGIASISGSVSVYITSGTVKLSVFGGGEYGYVGTGDDLLTIDISDSEIIGDVFGGGRYSSTNVSSLELSINNSEVDGDVFGGGMYGLLTSDTVNINLVGNETTIGGSVYGGGLGTEGELATVVSERTIVINGPTILGSVYGGSRDGDDNYVEAENGYGVCTTNIYILSGNISSGSSGNVYGGAYKGRSKMNANIYVGSAVPEQIGYPVERTFSIHSIFGGASVGQVDDDYETSTVLLFGNTSIRIGGEGYTGSITGNVFGEGDYCRISGSADIEFIGFSNPSDVSMLSIQKADSVTLVDTELVLDGDVDGNSTSGSAKLSINDAGMLTLVGHGYGARSGLTMNAQVSTLSGYESVHEVEFIEGDEYLVKAMNYLHLNGGKMFSVLGKNNDGTGMGTAVSGATVLIRDDNPYYGALAISGPSIDSTATFVLEDGTEAGMTVYNYGGVDVTVWYIAGAFTVDETVTLVSGIGNDAAIIGIPKMVSGSVIEYVGHYTSMNSEGSLNVVENLDGTTAGEDFQVMLGTKDGSIWYGWEKDGSIQYGLNLASAESGTQFQGTGATIGLSISTNSPFTMTGYAGTIHIHMVEVYGGITIGTFDIEVAVFLSIPQPDEDTYKINQDLLVKDYGDNKHEGTTDVYLPVLDGGAVGTYTLLSVSGIPEYNNEYGKLTMSLESTYLNKSGWLTRLWDGDSLENKTSYNAVLGDGGLFSPVLGFDFTCPGHNDPGSATEWSPITITVQVVWTDGGVAKSQIYEIVLTPKHASERTVSFYDKWLSSNDNYTWQYLEDGDGTRLPSFTLSVEFGDSLAGLFIAIDVNGLKTASSNWSVKDYLSNFQDYLYQNKDGHAITARSADEILEAAGTGYVAYPVYSYEESRGDLLDVYQNLKREVVEDSEEGYLKNIRWFDNPTGPAEFNFYSQVTDEGLSLYVGYGVILTFKAEVDGDKIGDDSIWVSPNTRFLEDLSREVIIKELANSLRVTAGYKIIGFKDSQDEDITNQKMRILKDTIITVVLQAETYTLDITVKDDKGEILFGDGVTSDAGIQIERSPETLHYGDKVSIMVKYTGNQQYRILGAEGEYGNFTLSKFTFTQDAYNTYSICEFQMPNGDLELTITLSEGYSLTVSIPESSPHTDDNHLFGLSKGADGGFTVSSDGAADEVILNLGLNALKDIAFMMPEAYGSNAISISIGSHSGADVEIKDSTLILTNISDDVSVELLIHVEWKLTFSGDGYSVSKAGVPISTGSTVHTGDVLTLTTHQGYAFDVIPNVVGAVITSSGSETVVMTVSGTGDVSIEGDAIRHSIIVTVVIDFRTSANLPEVSSIKGVATVGDNEVGVGEVTLVNGRYSFIVEVLSGAQFSVTATIDGYIVSVYTGSSDEDVEVTIHSAERTTAEGPQEATGSLTISTVSDRVNDTYTVADVDGLGKGTFTFGDRRVIIGEGSVVLSGFDGFVGTMVLYSYEMGTLTIVSYPVTVGA